jgi:hypothetical protein
LDKVIEIEHSDPSKVYHWIQDPFLALKELNGMAGVLEPYYAWLPPKTKKEKLPESLIVALYTPEILSTQTHLMVRSTPFFFQGGNVLVGDGFVFIGRNILARNMAAFGKEPGMGTVEDLKTQMANSFGVDRVYCPDYALSITGEMAEQHPKLFHLDLFITLAGKLENGKILVFVGELMNWNGVAWEAADAKDVVQKEINKVAANIASITGDHEFQVERVPLLLHERKTCSFNNCLVEITAAAKHVILPWYGTGKKGDDSALTLGNELAERVFIQAGFHVSFVDYGFLNHASQGASLHCITHVLARNEE